MAGLEYLDELRRRWRVAKDASVPSRISTARLILHGELEKSLRTLAKARRVDSDGYSNPPFWIFAASHFPDAKRMESLFADPQCSWGWLPPFALFDSTDEELLLLQPGARAARVFRADGPSTPWFPISQYSGLLNCIVEWAPSTEFSETTFDEAGIDGAIRHATESAAEWQAFWNNDARWQRELPDEWLDKHVERLKRHVAVLKQIQDHDVSQYDCQQLHVMAIAVRAIRDLSRALVNDASDLGLGPENESLGLVKRLAVTADVGCPHVLRAELASPEWWDSARGLLESLKAAEDVDESPVQTGQHNPKPCEAKAYSQYCAAIKRKPLLDTVTDNHVYDFYKEEMWTDEDEELPSRNDWVTMMRKARTAAGKGKNTRRAGRARGRSIAQAEEL